MNQSGLPRTAADDLKKNIGSLGGDMKKKLLGLSGMRGKQEASG